MVNRPYERFSQEEIVLRDYLAADRTLLANERTYLSYIRTALAFAIAGASALHFLEGTETDVLGVFLLLVGVLTFGVGSWRYIWYKRRIESITGKAPPNTGSN